MKTILAYLLIFLMFTTTEMQVDNGETKLTIYGTSTLHDWEMDATNCSGTAQILMEDGQVKDITSLSFEVQVKGLKSGKAAMDENTYKALNAEKYPRITYTLTEIEKAGVEEGVTLFDTKGQLTISGTTKLLNMKVKVTALNKGLKIEGDTRFNMTTFNVEPPTVMFGTVSTGDAITIRFTTVYNP